MTDLEARLTDKLERAYRGTVNLERFVEESASLASQLAQANERILELESTIATLEAEQSKAIAQ